MTFGISIGGNICSIIVEETAFEGVRRIAETLAGDIECVCSQKPVCKSDIIENLSGYTIVAATLSRSHFLEKLDKNDIFDGLKGKRECYAFYMLDAGECGVGSGQILLVAGSDKRGTIYGLLNISERCGVSPLIIAHGICFVYGFFYKKRLVYAVET